MAWTTPKTDWETGELVAASDMNEIGENLATLKQPATAVYTTTENITDRSRNSFADVDSNFNLTLITTGGDVMVHFHGSLSYGDRKFDVEVDGSRIGDSNHGLWSTHPHDYQVSLTHLIQGLSAGSHTFKLQSKGGDSRTLRTGTQFWVREI